MCKVVGMVNKNVALDEKGRECYKHPTNGRWMPGEYTRRGFVWLYDKRGTFSADRRPYTMPDGSEKWVRVTRYTYGLFTKPAKAPVGKNGRPYKRASQQCARSVYFDGKSLWCARNVAVDDGWLNTIVPFTGHLWDCHDENSVKRGIPVVEMDVVDGIPTTVYMDGAVIPVDEETWLDMVVPSLEIKC